MDRHLHQLVTQTERYAAALALAFHDDNEAQEEDEDDEANTSQEDQVKQTKGDSGDQAEPEPSPEGPLLHRGTRSGSGSDSDFDMDAADDEDDDETTIAAEEARGGGVSVEEELQVLEEESTMSIEALRARYAAAFSEEEATDEEAETEAVSTQKVKDRLEENDRSAQVSSDSDFEDSMEESEDDETTIAAAERAVSVSEVDAEVAALKEESEMSIDELRARYATLAAADNDDNESESDGGVYQEVTRDNEDDDGEEDDDADGAYDPHEEDSDDADDETTIVAAEAEDAATSSAEDELALLEEENQLTVDELRARYFGHCLEPDTETSDKPEKVENNPEKTEKDVASEVLLSPTRAGFKRPYLLTSRLSLREYQEAGVNWLVSLCEKRINGILADEMGLGKTIQTISMLAHLACSRGVWGPHLIVVPTSCMVNWEMELKRWCPALKVLTYFGSARRRKALRAGWSRANAFHVCVTSYQLVVQDAPCFKRKKWFYLILDEAHHIKNWKSLRWQTLLHFNAQRRLLLTGTPLQNNIMELWALMHFLMPHVFASRQEFTYWFNSPLTAMVEGETDVNQRLVAQLHGIIRPFVLRRLKRDVAKQMPRKIEHVLPCRLSKRQRFLYEDFISRSSTRRAMYGSKGGAGPNVMSMMNVLMQLRKVCNHPDLFEPRPIASPLDLAPLELAWPTCASFLIDSLNDNATQQLGLYGGRLASFFGSPYTPPLVPDATDALAWWPLHDRLVNQTLRGAERYTAQRRRALLIVDDLSLPEPQPLAMVDPQATGFGDDVRARVTAMIASYEAETRRRRCVALTTQRVLAALHTPLYGADLVARCTLPVLISPAMDVHVQRASPIGHRHPQFHSAALHDMVRTPEDRIAELQDVVRAAVCVVPKARARPATLAFDGGAAAASHPWRWTRRHCEMTTLVTRMAPIARGIVAPFYESFKRTQLFFPDKRLLQFDCGKLQRLATLLRELKRDGHRCLIFTQMSAMLNILESFLNLHGHTYFRMDGATDVERRQYLMERFNQDDKIFCFILSTRSGGLGVNLVGADVVIFYDSDWNPAMDAQAQDRAHRIGQTRDVHIYRLVSEHTVEENILRKAQQKRHLDALVLRDGQFTTEFFSKASLRELVGELRTEATTVDNEEEEELAEEEEEDDDSLAAIERAMAELEDEEDVVAMRGAREEELQEAREFDEDATETTGDKGRRPGRDEDEEEEHEEGDQDDAASETKGGGSTETSRASTPSNTAVDDRESVDDPMTANGAVKTEDSELMELDDGGANVEPENAGATSDALMDEEEDDNDLEEDGDGESEDLDDDDDDDMEDDESDMEEHPRRQRRGVKRDRRDSTSSEQAPNSKRRKAGGRKTPTKNASSTRSTSTSSTSLQAPTPQQEQQRLARAAARAKERARDQEEERQLQAWKDSVSSLQHFEDSLNPVDRYALHFREQIDPLYAYVPTAEAVTAAELDAASASATETIEAIEAQKMMEEAALLADGELHASAEAVALAATATTALVFDDATVAEHAALFKRERARVHSERRRRQLTGAAWQVLTCAVTRHPFFYNADTREATWDRPAIWTKNEDDARARRDGYAALPMHVLLAILRCLDAWPDRLCAATVCRAWHSAAQSPSLCRRITASEFVHGHRSSLHALLQDVRRGETLLFGAGVYEISDSVTISTAVRLVATPDSRVELAMVTRRAKLRWTARSGVLCGFHVTRRHSASIETTSDTPHWQHLVHVADGGRLRIVYCDLDGNHLGNACVAVSGARESKTEEVMNGNAEQASASEEQAPKPIAPEAAATTAGEGESKSVVAPASGDDAEAASSTTRATPTEKKQRTTRTIPSELMLQQSRVFHAGSGSGVLVLSGLAVLQRNTIFGNALAGVTVLGGNAVLRRNRVHGNGRFGVRLLYHANNVIIEENDVGEHPCGALDVENSGRRFVVRWNDMQRDEPTDLPHDHGTWRLVTSRIEERVIEAPPPTEKKLKKLPTSTATPRPAMNASPTSSVVTAAAAAAGGSGGGGGSC
ncbi:hypothetical protein PINS_up013581 [Pythium insidiosum]|nr:hypothetical protein PINS_up013581 [Pythium insidiosum]